MVKVEECALCAFKEDSVVAANGFLKDVFGIADVRGYSFGVTAVFFVEIFELNWFAAEKGDESVFEYKDLAKTFGEDFRMDEFAHADAHPLDFIGVHGADPSGCRADFVVASGGFFELVEEAVVGENDVGGGGDFEFAEFGLLCFGRVDFVEEGPGTDCHAASENAEGVGVEDSGGEEVKFEGFPASYDGVSGVVSTAVTDYIIGLVTEDVDDFAFGFIAPLGSDNDEG